MFRWPGLVLLKRWCAAPSMSACSASLRHAHFSGSKTRANVTAWDCRTWPWSMTKAEIKDLLKGVVKPEATVDYDGLAYALSQYNEMSLKELLQGKLCEPREVDVEILIATHVQDTKSPMWMKVVDQDLFFRELRKALLATTGDPSKPWFVYAYAMRGSGKTQVLKHAVHKLLLERAKRGRVIVRCCEKSANRPWMVEARAGRIERALCELIAEHLREVVGPTEVATTAKEAYAEWYRRTKEHFGMGKATSTARRMKPIIMLDACEMLATVAVEGERHSTVVSGRMYNALELLATAVPAPHRMVTLGCNAGVANEGLASQCNVVSLPTLTPIRHEHHAMTVRAWDEWEEKIDASVKNTVYLLTGGLPRLLRLAHHVTIDVSLASGAVDALTTCFDAFVAACAELYSIKRVDVAYCCYLASMTRWPVYDVEKVVPMPPGSAGENTTFKQAMEESLGMYDAAAKVFVMPPVLGKQLGGFVVPGVILPRPGDLCPLDVVPDPATNGGSIARGVPFEKVFLHALHARYLLCCWSQKCTDGWVELADVLQSALSVSGRERIAGLRVNLAGGVCDAHAESYDSFSALSNGEALTIQWNRKQHLALHDAYIRCRQGSAGRLVTVPIQIRHGTSKAPRQRTSELRRSRSKKERERKIEDVLLSVCNNKDSPKTESEGVVCVCADAMVFLSHLYKATPYQASCAASKKANVETERRAGRCSGVSAPECTRAAGGRRDE